MSYGHYIKEIGRGAQGARDLTQEDARQLYAAMLDGGVPDLELGAIIVALRVKGESLDEMLGFLAATDERTHPLEMPPGRGRPVVLPTYNGARKEANLTPLLALLLQRFGVPVLVHGLIEGYGRVTSAHIFRELGVLPVASPHQAQAALDDKGLAFMPLSALCPGIHNLLSLRARMGVRNSAHSLVKLLDPLVPAGARSIVVGSYTHPEYAQSMAATLALTGACALLLRGTEGEPVADARRTPQMDAYLYGQALRMQEAQGGPLASVPALPTDIGAASTAAYTRAVLQGEAPVPAPVALQVQHLVALARQMR